MGQDSHKTGRDGLLDDGVSHYPANAQDWALLEQARSSLAAFNAPKLKDGPNARLFVAAFDGTGNDALGDPAHMTNVGEIRRQIKERNLAGDTDVAVGYVEGIGTQSNALARAIDGATGRTFEPRLERMYTQLMDQAVLWRAENPNVQINVADIGFSRGAEQAAAFARMVHERGIQDPSGRVERKDDNGRTVVEYTKPPLVPPGQVAQSVGLFDPVGTGEPRNHDRRLPPSVISGVQLTAEDERRGLFKGTDVIDQGMTPDGRFLGLMLPGCHSDIGGSYHRNGLSIRAGNLMTDYLNSLSDTPFLEKRAEPTAPGMNVIHRSEEGMFLYRMWDKVDRMKDGRVDELTPQSMCGRVADCRNAEARDESLASRFEFAPIKVSPAPVDARTTAPVPTNDATVPTHAANALLLQSMAATDRLDTRLGLERSALSDRLAVDGAVEAQKAGLTRIDHIVLNEQRTHALIVEGRMDAPPRRIAQVELSALPKQDVATSLQRLDDVTDQRLQREPARPTQVPEPATPAFAR